MVASSKKMGVLHCMYRWRFGNDMLWTSLEWLSFNKGTLGLPIVLLSTLWPTVRLSWIMFAAC